MRIEEEDANSLMHYGIIRRSGRYPWGSHQPGGPKLEPRNPDYMDFLEGLKRDGLSDKQISEYLNITQNQLRAARSIATNARRASRIGFAERLKNKGYSLNAIATRMGESPSTVRGYLAPGAKERTDILTSVSNMLKERVGENNIIDVGRGTETQAGVSNTRLNHALEMCKLDGYNVYTVPMPQLTGSHNTNTKVLCPPGMTQKEAWQRRHEIQQINMITTDGGRTYGKLHEPLQVNPNRLSVVFKEDGGDKADGMIYVRPGVKDLEMGGARYAQVRVAIGPDHYLKGMAIYKDDLPDGVDLEFHTSKSRTEDKLDALKKNADEPGYLAVGEHPLMKSITKQIIADPGTDKERVTSALNIVSEEGDWEDWSRNLSSQMLSKQKPILAKEQLNKRLDEARKDFEEISNLTNPTVRQKLLKDFADSADSAAVSLKAASLPRTGGHVLLPIPSIKQTEIYAPKYRDGERVVLIRHPHAGPFEIPELTVNNRNRAAKKIMGDATDAVGIHPEVAKWLSGADFDGDTVLVIPNNAGKIRHEKVLDELKDFDPRDSYRGYEGMKVIGNKQAEMGKISNLITDMSIHNAPHSEIARAVKHSMVVIDAEKHELDYRRSYEENGIAALKKKYQTGGASTLLSRAGAKVRGVPQRRLRPQMRGGHIDPKTGELIYEPTNKTYWKKNKKTGEWTKELRVESPKRLSLTNDARTLMSTPTGTPMELLYAEHSNNMKSLANRARLELLKTPNMKYSKSAKKAYPKEVEEIDAKIYLYEKNKPLERAAQAIGNRMYRARLTANPDMDDDEKAKARRQSLTRARSMTGYSKLDFKITQKQWDAIQAGAISHNKLLKILDFADQDSIRALATPRQVLLMSPTNVARANTLLKRGKSRSEVAQILGVSLSTLDRATKGG